MEGNGRGNTAVRPKYEEQRLGIEFGVLRAHGWERVYRRSGAKQQDRTEQDRRARLSSCWLRRAMIMMMIYEDALSGKGRGMDRYVGHEINVSIRL